MLAYQLISVVILKNERRLYENLNFQHPCLTYHKESIYIFHLTPFWHNGARLNATK